MMFKRLMTLFSLIAILGVGTWARADGPTRVYRGTWNSQSTGHSGPMRVRVTDRGNGQYDARFSGRFALVIPFTYSVSLSSTGCDECGGQGLVAHKRLGPILGSYDMSASMTASGLSGGFRAAGDTGTVSMHRVR